VIELYDHEVDEAFGVLARLQDRAAAKSHNYTDFEREIRERFAEIGFVVHVNWHGYSVGGQVQAGSAMPEVTITGRTDPKFAFDPDRQVHEVTANILEIPGQEGVIKTDPAAMRGLLDGNDRGHGRSR
jgi:hypothetical protein